MKEKVTLLSVDDGAVEQLLCSVQVCDRLSVIMRAVSVLLNCLLIEVYFIVYLTISVKHIYLL